MVSYLSCPQVVLVAISTLALLPVAEGACRRSHEIECRDRDQCVHRDNICNNNRDCSDGSDEDQRLCKLWPPQDRNCHRYPSSPIYYSGGCRTMYYMCRDASRATMSSVNPKICKIILQSKLEIPNEGMNMSNEIVALLSSAVNSTLDTKVQDCPMLYTRVGNDCFSFFSPAKVSWAEARQFCLSIYGDLLHIKDTTNYGPLMEYMREAQFTSNYWIGGRYDLATNAWSWARDDSAMPLGAPFWSIRHEDSCVLRGPPHTDPYSAPPAALPGARCYTSVLSPKKRVAGWCSAMTYEYFYYWSDEMCDEAFSPLCIFTGPAVTREADPR